MSHPPFERSYLLGDEVIRREWLLERKKSLEIKGLPRRGRPLGRESTFGRGRPIGAGGFLPRGGHL